MTITVQYSAQLRVAAGVTSENVAVEDGCTLRQLAARLAERHGQAFRELLLASDGNPRPSNIALVREQMVRWNETRALRDGDVVAFLSPIAGG
jgi:molybdopterin converting factor small subunit